MVRVACERCKKQRWAQKAFGNTPMPLCLRCRRMLARRAQVGGTTRMTSLASLALGLEVRA